MILNSGQSKCEFTSSVGFEGGRYYTTERTKKLYLAKELKTIDNDIWSTDTGAKDWN